MVREGQVGLVALEEKQCRVDLDNLVVRMVLEDLEDLEDPLFQKFPETQEVSSTQFGNNLIYLMDY